MHEAASENPDVAGAAAAEAKPKRGPKDSLEGMLNYGRPYAGRRPRRRRSARDWRH